MRTLLAFVGVFLFLSSDSALAQDWQRRLDEAQRFSPPIYVPRQYEQPTYSAPRYETPSNPSPSYGATPYPRDYSGSWNRRPAVGPYDEPTLGDPQPRVWGQWPTLGDSRPYRNTSPRTCRGLLCD